MRYIRSAPAGGAQAAAPAHTVTFSSGGRQSVVHVAGAVRRPGVYTLAAGARVQDAVRRAGGARAGADLAAINLAARVVDGQQIVLPRRPRRLSLCRRPHERSGHRPEEARCDQAARAALKAVERWPRHAVLAAL